MAHTVKTLNEDYDISSISSIELVDIMKDLCEEYAKCYNEMSTGLSDVLGCIVRVADEIKTRG